ncbi:hypothetical protein J4558_08170 [Leptolyngbya sp. 15MV]|nr:hypothetical protein J4558_08170 [Leptolyngbya sp. 15MV]
MLDELGVVDGLGRGRHVRARPLGDVSGVSGRVDAGGGLAGRRGLRLGEGGCRQRGAGSQGEDDDACTVHV